MTRPASRASEEQGADVGMTGRGHGERAAGDAAGRRDGLFGTHPPPGRTAAAMRARTTAGSATWSRRNRQNARSTSSGRRRSSPDWVMASTWLCAAAASATSSRAVGSLSTRRPVRHAPRSRPGPPRHPHRRRLHQHRSSGTDAEALEGSGRGPPMTSSQSPELHGLRLPASLSDPTGKGRGAHSIATRKEVGGAHPVARSSRRRPCGRVGVAPVPSSCHPAPSGPSAGNLTTVRVTMMLCDAAQVSDGKLYVLGGVGA